MALRYYVHTRESLQLLLATHKALTRKLALERRVDSQDETIVHIVQAIRQLMAPREPKRRPIGFVTPEEKKHG